MKTLSEPRTRNQAESGSNRGNGPNQRNQILTEANPTRGLRGIRDSEPLRNLEDLKDSEESVKISSVDSFRELRKEGTEGQEQVPYQEPKDSKDQEQGSCRNPKDQEDNEDPDKIPTDLPLDEYTIRGHRSHHTDGPDHDETWRSETWEFTRFMKRHPNLRDLTGTQAANIIPWHLTDFDEDEQFQIVNEWDAIRYVAGEGPLNKALALGLKYPVPRKTNLTRRFTRYAEFLSFAGWLQFVLGEDSAIYLPQHKMSGIFHCDRSRIRNFIRCAIRDGYLTVVHPHSAHTATRFKFHLDKWPGHFRL